VSGHGTPALVALAAAGVPHTVHTYHHDPAVSFRGHSSGRSFGAEAATALNVSTAQVFKTLVADVDGSLVVAVVPVGVSAGTFLAVDWALMTDIIPRASSGRYMGLSNVVTASSTTIAVIIGGFVIDLVNKQFGAGSGVRIELLFGVAYFALGAMLLRPVVEPDRRTATTEALAA